jgi:hypothetical protein
MDQTVPLTRRLCRKSFLAQFWKTQFCDAYYRQGWCDKRTEECEFAHGAADLAGRPDLRKTSLCKAWMARKCASRSNRCNFAHGVNDMRYTESYIDDMRYTDVQPQVSLDTATLSSPNVSLSAADKSSITVAPPLPPAFEGDPSVLPASTWPPDPWEVAQAAPWQWGHGSVNQEPGTVSKTGAAAGCQTSHRPQQVKQQQRLPLPGPGAVSASTWSQALGQGSATEAREGWQDASWDTRTSWNGEMAYSNETCSSHANVPLESWATTSNLVGMRFQF